VSVSAVTTGYSTGRFFQPLMESSAVVRRKTEAAIIENESPRKRIFRISPAFGPRCVPMRAFINLSPLIPLLVEVREMTS